ncbi:hypothetical protein ACLB2K_019299 [Fragaria x ananassa]
MFIYQEWFADTLENLSSSITAGASANAASIKALHDSMEASIARIDGRFNQLWEKGDSGNQFEQVNEPIVQAGAQPVAANVVAQHATVNGVVRLEDIQGIYDRALQQLITEFRTELRDPGVNLTYQTPFLNYVAGADWPLNYRNICFTIFSGEGSEDAATHISRFQSEYGSYGNNHLLKVRVFSSFLAGSALTWYTKLVPGSIPDWATMERMFRTIFGTVKLVVDLSSLPSMYQQPTESPVELLKRFKVQHAKCRSLVLEEDVVRITIKGLEPRQRLKHYDGQFASMADLMNKVGSYRIVLNDMDERQNVSKGTYVPGTLKPRYGPNRHKTWEPSIRMWIHITLNHLLTSTVWTMMMRRK